MTIDLYPFYPYLIVIGSSILAGAGWLLYQYRRQALRIQELIRLNEELEYDLPDFLRQCWQSLKKGGFTGITWSLNWFGTTVSGTNGRTTGPTIEKTFEVQEIALIIQLYLGKSGWEQRYFSRTLAENFFLLVRMNLWIKLGTVKGAFDQSAKMTVFLKHDVKNMAQLISLSADQLENPVPGQEAKVLESLKTAIPAVRDRAQHMLNQLMNTPDSGKETEQRLERVLQQTASAYELPFEVTGNAIVSVQKDTLQSIIDNLLGNYSRQSKKQNQPRLDLQIRLHNKEGFVTTYITDCNGEPCLWPERLFEPFWSEHGSGLGIGLYQARQLAFAIGGKLTADAQHDKPLCFILVLPCKEQVTKDTKQEAVPATVSGT
jgi:signal transduction histidine kinase